MLRVFFVLVVLFACSHAVHADNREKALKLFEDSDKAYKAGKFEKAADLLKRAYGLYPEPILLYNLGRAQEGLGDTKGAIDSYERYLSEAKEISDRGAIVRRIDTLKAQIEREEEEARQRAIDAERHKQEEEERRRREALAVDNRTPLQKYGPWATIGVGGALVGTGIVFGIRSGSKHDDAIAAAVQRDAQALQESAEKYATIANVLFVLGGAAVIGGGIWEYFEWKRRPAALAHLRIAPTSIGLAWELP